jgi:hypothetical protein
LLRFNTKITEVIDALSFLVNEERTQTASEFLEMTSKVKKIFSYFSDFTKTLSEEAKEDHSTECFDWLFCMKDAPTPKKKKDKSYDSVMNQEDLKNIQNWFNGRNFELERLYKGTIDGFDSTSFI